MLVLCHPGLRGRVGIAEQRLGAGIVGAVAEHGVELAREQHRDDLLVFGRALGGVDIFGDVGVLERHPVHALEVEAVIIGEHAAQPRPGRGGEGADADALAGELRRRQRSVIAVVDREGVLHPRRHHRRQQHHRLAEGLGDQVGHDRHLRDVERALPHHRLEARPDRRHVGEVERDAFRGDFAALERRGVGIIGEQGAQPHRSGLGVHHSLSV